MTSPLWQEQQDEDVALDTVEHCKLVVYNDDVNTFDWVIETLVKVCGHDEVQAEQCTWLIHFKGKCAVKSGTWDELVPMRTAICDRGISAEVELG